MTGNCVTGEEHVGCILQRRQISIGRSNVSGESSMVRQWRQERASEAAAVGGESRKDVLALEWVQRRFMRMVHGMESLTYEEHLRTLGLYSLEFRRMRGNLIETFRILNGLDKVDVGK
eukprot:g30219.t1